MQTDKEAFSAYYYKKSLADAKQFVYATVSDVFIYFQAQQIECDASIMEFESYGQPSCGVISGSITEFKDNASNYFRRTIPSSPLRLSKEKRYVDLQDGDFILIENEVYLPFYYIFPLDEFKYALRFVENDTENIIAVYPPKFE
jgi:hypothetical protein